MFINRRDWERNGGGDVTQMLQLQRYAVQEGYEVDVFGDRETIVANIHRYDIVHVFNAQRVSEALYYLRVSADAGKPSVLSPMYDDFSAQRHHHRSLGNQMLTGIFGEELYLPKDILRVIRGVSYPAFLRYSLTRGFLSMFREVGTLARFLVPNSRSELSTIRRLFGIPEEKMHVIPNAIEPEILQYPFTGEEFRAKYKIPFRNFVLSVSRFAERKNPLNLLRAVKGDPEINLVLIAERSPINTAYYKHCMQLIDGAPNIVVIEKALPMQELVGAYRACHAHALTSWVETPGLSNLEAGLFGANLVVGHCPAVSEYFQDWAYYCRQDDPDDIRATLRRALKSGRGHNGLKKEILRKFSWPIIGKQYSELYERCSERN